MRVVTQENSMQGLSNVDSSLLPSESPIAQTEYHELAVSPVHEMDALAQLHGNLERLADLNGRLSFLMKEVRYLLKA